MQRIRGQTPVPRHREPVGVDDPGGAARRGDAAVIRGRRDPSARRRFSAAPVPPADAAGPREETPPPRSRSASPEDEELLRTDECRIQRAVDAIVACFAVGDPREVKARGLEYWKHPAQFAECCPQRVLADTWMPMQVYRIAASVSEAFVWSFFESNSDDEDQLAYADQVATCRGLVQREAARVEAHKCTLEILYVHVLDAVPAMAPRILQCVYIYISLVTVCKSS